MMTSFAIIAPSDTPPLHPASRIDFGTYYPVQFNVKAKDLGHIPDHNLLDYWRSMHKNEHTEGNVEGRSRSFDNPAEHDDGREDNSDEDYDHNDE
jgi:hypothetical protein